MALKRYLACFFTALTFGNFQFSARAHELNRATNNAGQCVAQEVKPNGGENSFREILAAANIETGQNTRIVSMIRVDRDCAEHVAAIYPQGLILSGGKMLEWREGQFGPGGQGVAQLTPSDCGSDPRSTFSICRKTLGRDHGKVMLTHEQGEDRLRYVSDKESSVLLLLRDGARVKDLSYLASPDSSGGLIRTFLASDNTGFLITIQSLK